MSKVKLTDFDKVCAWIIALIPLLAPWISRFFINDQTILDNSDFLVFGGNIALCYYDEYRLKKKGIILTDAMGFIVPYYLYERGVKTNSSNIPVVLWCICFLYSCM